MADTGCDGAGDHCYGRRSRRVVRREAIPVGRIDRGILAAVYVHLRRQTAAEALNCLGEFSIQVRSDS